MHISCQGVLQENYFSLPPCFRKEPSPDGRCLAVGASWARGRSATRKPRRCGATPATRTAAVRGPRRFRTRRRGVRRRIRSPPVVAGPIRFESTRPPVNCVTARASRRTGMTAERPTTMKRTRRLNRCCSTRRSLSENGSGAATNETPPQTLEGRLYEQDQGVPDVVGIGVRVSFQHRLHAGRQPARPASGPDVGCGISAACHDESGYCTAYPVLSASFPDDAAVLILAREAGPGRPGGQSRTGQSGTNSTGHGGGRCARSRRTVAGIPAA